jgi:capsular exopolysaccharide synthesis family protein
MSKKEATSLTETASGVSSPGKRVQILPDRPDVEWLAPPLTVEPPQPPGPGLGPYLHALRRRWLVSTTFGMLGAMVLAAAAWYFCVPEYTAEAFLQVSSTEQWVLFPTADPVTKFEIYKGTQQQLLKNPNFLVRPLRQSGISALSIVRQQRGDKLAWLQEELQVDFPGSAEIMRVSLKGKNDTEMKALVDAIVDGYLETVVGEELKDRSVRIDSLRGSHGAKEVELRKRRNELREVSRQLGTENPETLTLQQQNTLRQLFEYRKELAAVRFERMRAEGEIEVLKARRQRLSAPPEAAPSTDEEEASLTSTAAGGTSPAATTDGETSATPTEAEEESDQEVELAMQSDRLAMSLLLRQAELEGQLELTDEIAKPKAAGRYRSRQERELSSINEQLEARKETVRESIRLEKRALGRAERKAVEEEIATRGVEFEILKTREDELATAADELKQQAEKLGGSSIDIEMTQGEIKLLEGLVSNIGGELQKAEIENEAKPRVTSLGPAFAQCTNRNFRVALTVFAAACGFFLPVIGIAWWDTRGRRVNSLAEVSGEIGLDVIGSVPIIPSRVARRLGSLPARYRYWQAILTESVDGIAARLLHQAEHEPMRVILVSSAMENEGKTTIASQLALSLARTGRRTVLVDFDLRQPAIDGVFGLPSRPGVGDVLKRQSSASDVIHQGDGDNLDVITAGQWDDGSVRILSNGVTGSFLRELRADYDFVVLDASPILPVADTRIISQHVDGVVLSILRDVSQVPKVIAACEILQAFGVRMLGAIVTGAGGDVYSRSSKYVAEPTAERQRVGQDGPVAH